MSMGNKERTNGINEDILKDSRKIATLACQSISAKKGKRIFILDLSGVSLIADYFIICSVNSRTQTKAIADHLEEELKKAGILLSRREGYTEGRWILEDFGGVIVHIFLEEEREFYNLERLWGDAPLTEYNEEDPNGFKIQFGESKDNSAEKKSF
jgi:ribosome-associated protein